jgi:cell division protein FtsI/penicillin-binding protein 2
MTSVFKTRIGILSVMLGAAFLFVGARLFQLQVLRYEQYAALSHRDNDSAQAVPALRAPIYDRFGNVWAEDRPYYDLSVRVDRLKLKHVNVDEIRALGPKFRAPQVRDANYDTTVANLRKLRDAEFEKLVARLDSEPYVHYLAKTVKRDTDEIAAGLRKALYAVACDRASPRAPLTLVSGVDEKTWLMLRALHEDIFHDSKLLYGKSASDTESIEEPPFAGLVCTVSTRRVYPQGSSGCFILGTLGELSTEDEEELRHDGSLYENTLARARYWARLRESLDDDTVAKLVDILRVNPREIYELGDLYALLSRLTPNDKFTVSTLGLGEPVRWSERLPRMKLSEPEMLWLGVGLPPTVAKNRLPSRTIGETGIERVLNDYLRGKSGLKFRESNEKDAADALKFTRYTEPKEGQPVALTISPVWQRAVENALKSQSQPGAVVAIDVKTGEILAMASWPDFDPNLFVPPRDGLQRQEKLKELLENPSKPLLNRAISEQYPLGSVMKSMIAAVALEKGLVSTTETFECQGYIMEGGQKFHCDDGHAHGTVNLLKGIRCSCNVTFHQIGARIGVENLGPFAKMIFGKRTGVDLPGESSGIYPDRAWRMKMFPTNPAARIWTRGNDYQLAIGQGQMTSTVMQAAVLMAAMSNGGYVVTPHVWLDAPSTPPKSLGISAPNLAVVRQGLDEVVNIGTPGARGTAYRPFHELGELSIRVAGKTSTAEHKKGAAPHAWFAGYAPADNPQVAFAVMLEEAGHGGERAAPVAYKFLKDVYGTKNAPVKNPGAPQDVAAATVVE